MRRTACSCGLHGVRGISLRLSGAVSQRNSPPGFFSLRRPPVEPEFHSRASPAWPTEVDLAATVASASQPPHDDCSMR